MLTDKAIRSAKPLAKQYKLNDGRGGATLIVFPNGRKAWRVRLFRGDEETMAALGDYPEVSLASARSKAKELKDKVAEGRNVIAERRALRPVEGNRVRDIGAAWVAGKTNWTEEHRNAVTGQLERLVYPELGDRPITAVTASEILGCLRGIKSADLAARARSRLTSLWDMAVILGLVKDNPCRALAGQLPAPKTRHFRAITEPAALGDALVKIYGYTGMNSVKLALLFGVYTGLRPGAVRLVEFGWRDGDVLRVPSDAMKSGRDFACPLSTQAIRVLDEARRGTDGALAFPNRNGEPLSLEAMEKALTARCKVHASPHGLFRATMRTAMVEWLDPPVATEVAEAQLDHVLQGVTAAYHRGTWFEQRKVAVQRYGELCDKLEVECRLG